MNIINEIHQAIEAARETDQFAHRGQIAISIKAGKGRVERITYDANGNSTVKPCGKFVSLNLIALHLTAESQYGVGEV